MNLEELKKLYKKTTEVELNDFVFEIEQPSAKGWTIIMDIISKLDKQPELSIDIINNAIVGWKNIKVSNIVEGSDSEEQVDFSKEAFDMFLSANPEYIIALSNIVSNSIVKQKQKEESRKKK